MLFWLCDVPGEQVANAIDGVVGDAGEHVAEGPLPKMRPKLAALAAVRCSLVTASTGTPAMAETVYDIRTNTANRRSDLRISRPFRNSDQPPSAWRHGWRPDPRF